MHVDKLHAVHRGRGENSSSHCVWNVVEFQVEENAGAERRDFFNPSRSSGGKQLIANFEQAHEIRHLLRKLHGRR